MTDKGNSGDSIMYKKSIKILSITILVLGMCVTYSHAVTITLDGIANAVLWSEDKTKTHLNIWNETDMNYYYRWKYDGVTSLQWDNMDALVTDLNSMPFAWKLESGGDPFNSPDNDIWKSVYLTAGLYNISLTDTSSAYNLIDYWDGDQWNAYVQIWAAYDDSFNFGNGSPYFNSEKDALSFYHANIDGMTIYLQDDTDLFFYINDGNSIDNSGNVSLKITSAPVPEPSTVFMIGLGVALLFFWRQCQNKTPSQNG